MCDRENRVRPSRSGMPLDSETWDALRGLGYTESELEADQPFGPVIFAYTRAQAIEDGVLVDVTELARKQGFTIHTAATCGVVEALTAMVRRHSPEDFDIHPLYRIQASALRAMLWVLHELIAAQPDDQTTDRLHFQCSDTKLWAHIGPGDEAEPVLTIMLEGED